ARSVWQTPVASMSTTTSFGPGSGMMMSSSSAGCFSLRATTPLTVQVMVASFEVGVPGQPSRDVLHDVAEPGRGVGPPLPGPGQAGVTCPGAPGYRGFGPRFWGRSVD